MAWACYKTVESKVSLKNSTRWCHFWWFGLVLGKIMSKTMIFQNHPKIKVVQWLQNSYHTSGILLGDGLERISPKFNSQVPFLIFSLFFMSSTKKIKKKYSLGKKF
jgi:hypothetical protein